MPRQSTLTPDNRATIAGLWTANPLATCRRIAELTAAALGRSVGETAVREHRPGVRPARRLHPLGDLGRAPRNDGALVAGRGLETSPAPRVRDGCSEMERWIKEDRAVCRRLSIGCWRKPR